nr:hypothetical protein [Nostoc sp. ChiSLP03a]MDZ8212507.1 hypothetical protein [Nostoc sp. ChiSLP03a]
MTRSLNIDVTVTMAYSPAVGDRNWVCSNSNLCGTSLWQLYISLFAILSGWNSFGSFYLNRNDFHCPTSFRFLQ